MKTIIAGFDAFDPHRFESLLEDGRLPHLERLVSEGGYRRFAVSNPPQSEVSWTSIATGLDAGGHGIFDFVHRDPGTYGLQVSLLPMKTSVLGTQFVPPHNAYTLFDQAVDDGYPATVMWWPATFPARLESPVRTFPGLGAPDIQGRLGVGTYFSMEDDRPAANPKTPWEPLHSKGKSGYTAQLRGPVRKTSAGPRQASLALSLEVTGENTAQLQISGRKAGRLDLQLGRWSEIVEVRFRMGLFVTVRALTRFILTRVGPAPRLYALPLQPHPLRAPWRYAAPPGFVRRTWNRHGPFLTVGWPQDTTALEDGLIDDDQFLALCDSIFASRREIFLSQLADFQEGLLATVFDTLDRVQHMFWRDRPDVIAGWYQKLDRLAGEILERVPGDARLIFVSDHGFAAFDHKVHLNRWLLDQGYLSVEPGGSGFANVDWPATRAYALGLNSLYLNLREREGQGAVGPGESETLAAELRERLLAWRGPDGRAVLGHVWPRETAFSGPLAAHGPDLVLGYSPGYRASQETGTGGWGERALAPNRDHWGADHCMDPEAVPGVLLATVGLEDHSAPSFRDFPSLALGRAFTPRGGSETGADGAGDPDAVEERLKGLGYL